MKIDLRINTKRYESNSITTVNINIYLGFKTEIKKNVCSFDISMDNFRMTYIIDVKYIYKSLVHYRKSLKIESKLVWGKKILTVFMQICKASS